MNNIDKQLREVLSIKDERKGVLALEKFCKENATSLPLPGENPAFDKAFWNASQFKKLTKTDDAILARVTSKLLGVEVRLSVAKSQQVGTAAVLKLRDLLGASKEQAAEVWQGMLASMSWQQMVPATATRSVGTQMVSLGTFEKMVEQGTFQVNLGWYADKEQLRILVQAKDQEKQPMSGVEMRVYECQKGVVFTRKTNDDGAVVAPSVPVEPGQYKIQVCWEDRIEETPIFEV